MELTGTRTSRHARAAAMVLAMAAAIPAHAADIGSGCCAELEERVAELDAAMARKGGAAVSLHIYGQVNKALMFIDDGKHSDAHVVDNSQNSSRFGFRGNALIAQGWSAGYTLELDLNDAPSSLVSLSNDDPDDGRGALIVRQNSLYIENEHLGRITVGREKPASAGAYLVNLGQSNSSSIVSAGGGAVIVPPAKRREYEIGSAITLSTFATNFDADKPIPGGTDVGSIIRYDTPAIFGFVLSAAWGDNDYADAAVRFIHEFADFRVAGAMAYQWNNQFGRIGYYDMNFETFGGSVSVMHVATGIYGTFQAARQDQKDAAFSDPRMWYVQAGVERDWLSFGSTTVYGEFGRYTNAPTYYASEAERIGFGVNQKIDAAAMDVYMQATMWSFDDGRTGAAHVDIDDLTTVMIGSRIQF